MAEAMLYQVMDPLMAPVVRLALPDDTTPHGTAVARVINKQSYNWNVISENSHVHFPSLDRLGGSVPINQSEFDFPVVLLRDPVVRYITRELRPITAFGVGAQYLFEFNFPGFDSVDANTILYTSAVSTSLPLSYICYSTGWPCYGTRAPTGTVGGKRVVWIDATTDARAVVTVHVESVHAPNTNIELSIIRWDSPTSSITVIKGDTYANPETPPISLELGGSGYYELVLTSETGCPVTLINADLTILTDASYKHHMPAGLDTKDKDIDGIRMLGASLLLTNNAPEWQRGGTVTAAQVMGTVPWYDYFSDAETILNLNPQVQRTNDYSKGLYVYFKPTATDNNGNSPFALATAFQHYDVATISAAPDFRPFDQEGFVLARISPPDSITPNGPGSGGAMTFLTVTSLFEFTTSDQFYDIERPINSFLDYFEFLSRLRESEQFFENPWHMSDIKRMVFNTAKVLVKHGPKIIQAASYIMPYLA